MKTTRSHWRAWRTAVRVAGGVALGLMPAACDHHHHHREVEVVEYGVAGDYGPYDEVGPREDYWVDVQVTTAAGAPIMGAPVLLIVSDRPEQRASARTDPHGTASFVIHTYPGIAVTAYAEAPGFSDDFVTAYTAAGSTGLGLNLVLH